MLDDVEVLPLGSASVHRLCVFIDVQLACARRHTVEDIITHTNLSRMVDIRVNPGQPAAAIECAVADGGDGVGDGDRGQPAAARECVVADGCDGVGDGHRGQASAVIVFATYCLSAIFS